MTNEIQIELRNAGYKGNFDLSELIEACGDKFDYLERGLNGGYYAYHENFGPEEEDCIDDSGEGSTPEEAVARLYLAINAK